MLQRTVILPYFIAPFILLQPSPLQKFFLKISGACANDFRFRQRDVMSDVTYDVTRRRAVIGCDNFVS